MKKGNEIKNVLNQLKADATVKEDFIVPLKSFDVISTERYPNLLISERIDSSSGIELKMTDHSIGQLCHKLHKKVFTISRVSDKKSKPLDRTYKK